MGVTDILWCSKFSLLDYIMASILLMEILFFFHEFLWRYDVRLQDLRLFSRNRLKHKNVWRTFENHTQLFIHSLNKFVFHFNKQKSVIISEKSQIESKTFALTNLLTNFLFLFWFWCWVKWSEKKNSFILCC